MTTADIDEAITLKTSTLERLTTELADLQSQQKIEIAAQSTAIASGQTSNLGEVKRRVRERASDIDAHAGAIESVKNQIATLTAQRKTAEIREATAKADELAAQASEAVSALSSAFYKMLNEIEPLYAIARQAMSRANGADDRAKSLAGRPLPAIQTPRVSLPSGLELILEDLLRAVRSHNSSIELSANAAGVSVDRSTNLHSVR